MESKFVLKVSWPQYILGIFLTFSFLRLLSFLPEEYYFSFRFLFDKVNNTARPEGYNLAVATSVRLLVPVFIGLILGSITRSHAKTTAGLSAASAATLLWWPAVLLWDYYQPQEYSPYRTVFIVLYILYSLSFFFMAFVGASVSYALFGRRYDPAAVGRSSLARELAGALQPPALIAGVVSSFITTAISEAMTILVKPDWL